jgi:hypothetical protein
MTPNKCKCNWLPSIARTIDLIWGHTLGYYVYCENCGKKSRMMSSQEEAIIAWNKEED